MCRFAAYLGEPVLLEDLLYEPDGALVRQAVDAELMSLLNLGGFGLAAWDAGLARTRRGRSPTGCRRSPTSTATCARSQRKLQGRPRWSRTCAASSTTASEAVGAAERAPVPVRGRELRARPERRPLRLRAHALRPASSTSIRACCGMIEGTTDTEWVYALVLSRLRTRSRRSDPRTRRAPSGRRSRSSARRARRGIATQSPVNLVLTDGSWMLATRYAFDYGWYPGGRLVLRARARARLHLAVVLARRAASAGATTAPSAWTPGRLSSAVVASEPLTKSTAGWVEAPEYSMLLLEGRRDGAPSAELWELRVSARRPALGGRGSPVRRCDARSTLFAGIAAGELERVEHFMAPFRAAQGEVLFRQGEDGDRLYRDRLRRGRGARRADRRRGHDSRDARPRRAARGDVAARRHAPHRHGRGREPDVPAGCSTAAASRCCVSTPAPGRRRARRAHDRARARPAARSLRDDRARSRAQRSAAARPRAPATVGACPAERELVRPHYLETPAVLPALPRPRADRAAHRRRGPRLPSCPRGAVALAAGQRAR